MPPLAPPTDSGLTTRLRRLNKIGLALSSQHDIGRLLELILTTSRELTGADGGSLYIVQARTETDHHKEIPGVGKDNLGGKALFFRETQNDTVPVDHSLSFEVDATSLAGYAALTGQTLVFEDVYHIPAAAPYGFHLQFDQEHHYRSKSMLVVPLQNHGSEVIGVLQLVNRKRHPEARLTSPQIVDEEVIAFDQETVDLAASLASQAAVALENSLLLEEIENLFESFVTASAGAIEDRDPCTSGHSRRVTTLTVGLAEAVNKTTTGPYAGLSFNAEELCALRYAAMLHDFGKIGVREAVLTKSHKLEPARMDLLLSRLRLLQLQQQVACLEERAALWQQGKATRDALCELEARQEREAARINQLVSELRHANDPAITFLPDGEFSALQDLLGQLRQLQYENEAGDRVPLLSEAEAAALLIRKGSLTTDELRQIQEHAQLSYEFLVQIRWTAKLKSIPDIAWCHHEKLNGGGYPRGVQGPEICVQARMLTIADIFDALTASDRPYKKAMPLDRALDILHDEARRGMLDHDLLDIFIEKQVYRLTK